MTAVRQDAWSSEDDLILAEATLRHIRDGSTQLCAFEEVGEKIGRTAAACGFRWNSTIRKKHGAAIQIAKAQRQKRSQIKKTLIMTENSPLSPMLSPNQFVVTSKADPITEEAISFETMIRFLRQWKGTHSELNRQIRLLEKELADKDEEIAQLKLENSRLSSEVNHVQSDYRIVNDDYRALIQIMDRARKMAFLIEGEDESRSRFKMDANGNLERIE
jgi:prespore-specific regulator